MADLVRAIHASNLPSHHKETLVDKWIAQARGAGPKALAKIGVHGMQGVHAVTEAGSALVIGGAAGAVHATIGLDHGKVPTDLALGGLLALLSIYKADAPAARQAGVIGSQLLTVFSFRKVYDFTAGHRKAKGLPVGGGFAGEDAWSAPGMYGEDPQAALAQLARSLHPT